MFGYAIAFNQDLSSWPPRATSAPFFCDNAVSCNGRTKTPTLSPSETPPQPFSTFDELNNEMTKYCSDPGNYDSTVYG